jgi:hypothetical protein
MKYLKTHATSFLLALLAVVVGIEAVDSYRMYADDPLTVTYSGTPEQTFYLKQNDEFIFSRDVCVYQDLDVTVHREFHNIETGNKYMMNGVRYVAYADDGCYTTEFSANVPARVPVGSYEYRPILIYDVNRNLTIAKPAPVVRIEVIE